MILAERTARAEAEAVAASAKAEAATAQADLSSHARALRSNFFGEVLRLIELIT